MPACFLLGPAGTGKTFRCVKEISAALRSAPSGAPLALLAPKQATFQLERQLLSEGQPAGYTRLHILSFERLAEWVLETTGAPFPRLISEEGRQMVLQALLARRRGDLRIFRASAGLAGFARQLSVELRELQRRQMSPQRLRDAAALPALREALRHKLHDLALLLEAYLEWLHAHQLQDADQLLDFATVALRRAPGPPLLAALWMDGFAEMTPQELDLLASLAPRCSAMTLAFCLEDIPPADASWLSIWSNIGHTFEQCRNRIATALGSENVRVEVLRRGIRPGRFDDAPALRHLEESWAKSARAATPPDGALRLVSCANPAAEAAFAAREIRRFVRAGGRFREAAVLVRRLDGYQEIIRQVFFRYDIPFFLDCRERVAQHPAAELTRAVLRAAVFDWRPDDWFAALKTGLVTASEEFVDRLENEALERGWKGETWFKPLAPDSNGSDWAERFRQEWIAPFARWREAIASFKYCPTGAQLADAVETLWEDLRLREQLRDWAADVSGGAVHATVWEQLADWRENLARAFATEPMPLRSWLPILESGLSGLTVGLIPPALDKVLIGAVDRSRNPDLKLTLVLGANETLFPAAPSFAGLFNESDREELAQCGIAAGPRRRELLARERFLAYIACTRSRERVILTAARRDASDQPLNPSPFFLQIQSWFSGLAVESFAEFDAPDAEHPCELAARYARDGRGARLRELFARPELARWRELSAAFEAAEEPLPPGLAARLYGKDLKSSVSRLEEFAACAFKFFIRSGLRAEERKQFEADARERGSFQHEVLKQFHQQLRSEGKRWRDLTAQQARQHIGKIIEELLPQFREGILTARGQSVFAARALGELLQDYIACTVEWMASYQFDPHAVELGFGAGDALLPPWELDLGNGHRLVLRGVIDRVDLSLMSDGVALAAVIDYKSSQQKLDNLKMAHGLQLQLAAYLAVMRQLPEARNFFGVQRIIPAGVFYVNLRGHSEGAATRDEVFADRDEFRRRRFQHLGRFDASYARRFDSDGDSHQFNLEFCQDGRVSAKQSDPLSPADFVCLLDHVESELRRMGLEIYRGVIAPNPYQRGNERACDRCDYLSICRFDPWERSYRVLAGIPPSKKRESPDKGALAP